MSGKVIVRGLAALLIVSLIAPTALLVAPQRASAQNFVGCIGGLFGLGAGGGGAAASAAPAVPVISPSGNTLQATGNATAGNTAGSDWASCVNAYVVTPLIRSLIRALIQKLTANIINWINGANGANGTGVPSYVQNIQGNLQMVGTTQMQIFINQFAANTNSIFATPISSSLQNNYNQNANAAGFFAANQDTLVNVTGGQQNEANFLNGTWSAGGTAGWFALTTQNQNNPYILYQNSQNQLGSVINGAQSAQNQQLNWGRGFLSWCGAAPPPANGSVSNQSGTPIPGNPCQNSNGSQNVIQTPGSVIANYANQVTANTPFQSLISANDLDSAFNAIISALLGQVLGGAQGLFGASQGGNQSVTNNLSNYSTGANAAASPILSAAQTQAAAYASSWQAIAGAANNALAAVTDLNNFCTANANAATDPVFIAAATAQAAAAQQEIGVINQTLAQATSASGEAAAVQAMVTKIQNEMASQTPYATDLANLQTMPPSASDVSTAEQNAAATGGATATPPGSLSVSGGSTVDQMTLLSSNAAALKISVCLAPPPTTTTTTTPTTTTPPTTGGGGTLP